MSQKGTSTFVFQRASAVLLLPLVVWFLFNVVGHAGDSYVDMRKWLSAPVNSLLLGALVVIGAFHMRIGMSEVIADYIHSWMKDVLHFMNWIVALGVAATAIWSVYTLSFAG